VRRARSEAWRPRRLQGSARCGQCPIQCHSGLVITFLLLATAFCVVPCSCTCVVRAKTHITPHLRHANTHATRPNTRWCELACGRGRESALRQQALSSRPIFMIAARVVSCRSPRWLCVRGEACTACNWCWRVGARTNLHLGGSVLDFAQRQTDAFGGTSAIQRGLSHAVFSSRGWHRSDGHTASDSALRPERTTQRCVPA
jgi:hypothetical protein